MSSNQQGSAQQQQGQGAGQQGGGGAPKNPMTSDAASRIQSAADRGTGDAGFKSRAQSSAAGHANKATQQQGGQK